MPKVSPHAAKMPRSGIRRIMDAAWQIEEPVIGLHVGEPEFTAAPHVLQAGSDAYTDGQTHYVPNAGITPLREALTRKLDQHNQIRVESDQVVITAGGMQALQVATAMTVDPGDEVLIPEPGWPNFRMVVELSRATPVPYELRPEDGFLPRVQALAELVTERTKVLLVNTPSNPLGTVMPAALVEELVRFAEAHDLWLISDECYDGLTYVVPHVSPAVYDTAGVVLSAFSFSKTYAMTGVRVGYLACPPEVATTAAKLQETIISCVNAPAQTAALAALKGPQEHTERMRAAYDRRRSLAMGWLQEQGVPYLEPHGAFYIWCDVRQVANEPVADWALRLLREQHVAVAPGTTFGPMGEGWVRLSLAASDDDVRVGIERIGAMK
ncbi:pyridoxal phosphate-dependent aminotransferase [Pseudactinotalea sp. Z1739]|uniref:pyridoxal phosphate-dependent aminotransferase n=1 Tax=Pseudactinotalea sp. Z1739 TaxID=3413028 RepID=UPI003C7BF350